MKKLFIAILILLAWGSQAIAADWTLTPSLVSRAGHRALWKVVCTSNGSALTATDLVALMPAQLKELVQKASLMVMTVSPGTGAVAPDATIDVTLSNEQAIAIFTHTGYSNVADTTGISLAEDYGQYLPIFGKFYLTLSDIGTAGDQVTLYIDCWVTD